MEARGGVVGQAEFWTASHLLSTLGADILAVFLFIAALILITGATLAGLIRATGASMAETRRVIRRSTEELAARRPATAAAKAAAGSGSDLPPEPDTSELVVGPTHVEAPPIEGQGALPEAATEPEVEELGSLEEEDQAPALAVKAEDLTPQGRYRAQVSDDPGFEWRVPSARFLVRSTGEAARPDTEGQEQVARTLIETLGHFGVEARVIGRVTGPHITRYELRLAPGTKVAKVAQLKDDLAYSLAATDIRILAPIPGKQAVGVEVPNARRRIVNLGDVFQDPPADWSPLSVWLGKDIAG
ncbi:MAG: DNA translocase FtsK, partial [Solirubrobacterales bacterium]|nr:DNA translocase FtsK [Solirubrobacterales bacterium]